jgi:hypothetical protein
MKLKELFVLTFEHTLSSPAKEIFTLFEHTESTLEKKDRFGEFSAV